MRQVTLVAAMLAGVGSLQAQMGTPPPPAADASAKCDSIVGGRYPCVKYLLGHEGLNKEVMGTLVIGDGRVSFYGSTDSLVFMIPATTITDVSSLTNRQDPSTGQKVLFGFLAKSRRQDIVQVSTDTDKGAEGIEFEVKPDRATGIVAKIKHEMKQSETASHGQSPPAPSPAAPDTANSHP